MVVATQTCIASIPLVYFVLASVVIVFYHNSVRTKSKEPESADAQSENNQPKEDQAEEQQSPEEERKHDTPASFRLKKALLTAIAVNIALAVSESALQATYVGGFYKEANDALLADLIAIFAWTVLFLDLTNTKKLSPAHHGAFVLSLLVRAAALANQSMHHIHRSQKQTIRQVSLALISSQIAFAAVTCAIAVASSSLPPKPVDDSPETQPLLANENNASSRKPKKKEETDDDKARKALRDRPKMQYLKSFSVFIPFMWPSTSRQKAHVGGMIVCSALKRVIGILQPLTLGAVVNDLAQAWAVPWKSITIYILLRALDSNIGIQMIEDMLYMYLQNQQELAMKRAAYDHILNLSANFHDSKTTSHIWQAMYHARSAIALCHDAAFGIGPSVIDLAAGFLVLYALFGDYMGLLVLATIVLFLWMTVNALSPRADLFRAFEDCWYEETFQMLDSTQNWYTVAEFNQLPYEKEQFRQKGKASQDINISIWWYNRRSSIARYTVMTLAFTAACCLAAVQIARHEQKVGAFVTLTAYWAQLSSPLGQLVNEINSASEKLVRAEKLVVLLEKEPEIKEPEDAKSFTFGGGEVEFENVHFTYDGKRQASEGITFRAPPGSTTALVGETGGGKSTILKLLFRFYDPQRGRVLIDGQDLRDLQVSSFRKHIGWVPQDAAPFNKTILDNVKYSDLDLDTDAVEEACKDAALHDKIMTFTKKYQEKVGERGTKLSGGERQRLAIARAILKNPDILLLDEATSSVDSVTEAQIQASLEKLGRTKTTFIIAHRLSTILKADQILVIEKGKLVESGKHADLIKQDGAYKKLWESQLKLQADLEEKSEARSRSPKKELNLIDDVTEDKAEEPGDGGTTDEVDSKRGRRSTKAALKSISHRLSSRSSRRSSKENDGNKRSNGSVGASMSPSRSCLKADAPEFVPKSVQIAQEDGAVRSTDAKKNSEALDVQHDRRQIMSDSAIPGKDDSQSSDDAESGEEEAATTTKYSRIPQRSK